MATAKIQILSDGPMRGTSFQLPNESYTIGRSESCDICIPDSTISGHHCTLFQADEGVYMLRDEGSTSVDSSAFFSNFMISPSMGLVWV